MNTATSSRYRNRAPGTGTIYRKGDRFHARGPERDRKATHLGSFENRREAERALDAWIAENGKGAVAT